MTATVLPSEPSNVIRVKCDRCRTVSNFHASNTHEVARMSVELGWKREPADVCYGPDCSRVIWQGRGSSELDETFEYPLGYMQGRGAS